MSIQILPLIDRSRDAEPEPHAPPVRVALVNMPFAVTSLPSIQCGLLKGSLTRAGHTVDVFYLNLELAAEMGAEVYSKIASLRSEQFLGDWLFSTAAFGYRPNEAEYRTAVPALERTCTELGIDFETLCRMRNEMMPALIERWLGAVDWSAYAAVGFTSTFEQNVAALALARRVKEEHPAVVTIFGGANFDGEMGPEYMRAFPWIDYAVVGEGDEALPALIGRIGRGESGAGSPGVCGRIDGAVVEGGSSPTVRELDRVPCPDYDEYFATMFRLGREQVLGDAPPLLLFESSRGCWWGQKHHCTFCGLNANGMAFRAKKAETVLSDLRRLAERYQVVNFQAVDNIIDMRYLEELCGPLGEEHYDYSLFYEVKANLTRAQLHTMARAGINMIQPGIESLNTHVLSLMRKGTTGIRNVRLLKWALYYGIRVSWNLLCGFPGERREDYDQQERLIPLLFHLQPPSGMGPLWMERFSPYFTDPSFPVRGMRPRRAYSFIYPEERIDLNKIAYFFDYEMDDVIPITEHRAMLDVVDRWKTLWNGTSRPPVLVYQRASDWIQIVDRRGQGEPCAFSLQGAEADAYEFCGDTDHTALKVAQHLDATRGASHDVRTVETMLRRFCETGLMIEEDGHFLSLALPANPHW